MKNTNIEEIKKAFQRIETHELKVSTIICSVCGCVVSDRSTEKACEHLKEYIN